MPYCSVLFIYLILSIFNENLFTVLSLINNYHYVGNIRNIQEIDRCFLIEKSQTRIGFSKFHYLMRLHFSFKYNSNKNYNEYQFVKKKKILLKGSFKSKSTPLYFSTYRMPNSFLQKKTFFSSYGDTNMRTKEGKFCKNGNISRTRYEWEIVVKSLQIYLAAYGYLSIPKDFSVPCMSPWPRSAWRINLGYIVSSIRYNNLFVEGTYKHHKILNDIGFIWNLCPLSIDDEIDMTFHQIFDSKATYHCEIQPNFKPLHIPSNFIVPNYYTWPEASRGILLGLKVPSIQKCSYLRLHSGASAKLSSIGFQFDMFDSTKTNKLITSSLVGNFQSLFKVTNDDLDIKCKNCVKPLPIEKSLDRNIFTSLLIENRSLFGEIGVEYFEGIHADWMSGLWENKILGFINKVEMKEKKQIIPPNSVLNNKPEPIKSICTSVGLTKSHGGCMSDLQRNDDKLVPWSNDDFGENFFFSDVMNALNFHLNKYGTFDGLNAKPNFFVPGPSSEVEWTKDDANPVKWPKHLTGLKLGSIVSRMRCGSLEVKHIPERKSQLDSINFDWGNEAQFIDVPFEKAVCAMHAYFTIRGDLLVREDFVMPSDDPWPYYLCGYKLGKAVRRIRELQYVLEAYYPEKVTVLRMMEFMWFPELALPLNPEEGSVSWENKYRQGMGHPFFHISHPSILMVENLQSQYLKKSQRNEMKTEYDYAPVAEYWKKVIPINGSYLNEWKSFNPSEFLWWNGFSELSQEHEERYKVTSGLYLLRLLEKLHLGNITVEEFDMDTISYIQRREESNLRQQAIVNGIDVEDNDNIQAILYKIQSSSCIKYMETQSEPLHTFQSQRNVDEMEQNYYSKERHMEEYEYDDLGDEYIVEDGMEYLYLDEDVYCLDYVNKENNFEERKDSLSIRIK